MAIEKLTTPPEPDALAAILEIDRAITQAGAIARLDTIEDDGILKGSIKNERTISTTANTGKKSYAQRTSKLSLPRPRVLRCFSVSLSNSQIIPKPMVNGTKIKLKSKSIRICLLTS